MGSIDNRKKIWGPLAVAAVLFTMIFSIIYAGCYNETKLDQYKIVRMHGSHYQMGKQAGKALKNEIKSIYTQFMTNSILPYLNREYQFIAQYFSTYTEEDKYKNGKFSFNLLLDSAKMTEKDIPQKYLDEMQGIADGAGMTYEEILVINTFLDTLMGILTIDWYLKQVFAPGIVSVKVDSASDPGAIDSDGYDNDGDGLVDEGDEGLLFPYESTNTAHLSWIPTDPVFEYVLTDLFFEEGEGVDPESIRLEINGELFKYGDDEFSYESDEVGSGGTITINPGKNYDPNEMLVLIFTVADAEPVILPPPAHPNVLREERTVFAVAGETADDYYAPQRMPNYDFHPDSPGNVAGSINIAMRGAATADNTLMLGRNFNLLDNNVAHKHTAVYMYEPDDGEPYVTIGWTGIVWGLAGMNKSGIAIGVNRNETLNNSMAKQVLIPAAACDLIPDAENLLGVSKADLGECPIEGGIAALIKSPDDGGCFLDGELDANCLFEKLLVKTRLTVEGVPIGFIGREILEATSSIDEVETYLRATTKTAGWNITVADGKTNDIAGFEVFSNILNQPNNGVVKLSPPSAGGSTDGIETDTPNSVDITHWSLSADDLRQSNQFQKELNEIRVDLGAFGAVLFTILPQRYWASEYFVPVNTLNAAGILMKENYGQYNVKEMISLLREPDLTDKRNAMHSVVFLPETREMYVAIGEQPSNSGPFDRFSARKLGFE